MKYNFFLDVDGTLVHGSPIPSEKLLKTVARAQALGHRFFINTARPFVSIAKTPFPLQAFDGLCCGCGTLIEYKGKRVYENTISREMLQGVVDILLREQPELGFWVEAIDRVYYRNTPTTKEVNFFDDNLEIRSSEQFKNEYPDVRAQKLATYFGNTLSPHIVPMLNRFFDVYLHSHYTEIVMKGFSKGKAVQITEELLGLQHSTTVAIGDSVNDLSMLEYCAYSVAMGNAPEEVKKACSTETEAVTDNGAANAIERLCFPI